MARKKKKKSGFKIDYCHGMANGFHYLSSSYRWSCWCNGQCRNVLKKDTEKFSVSFLFILDKHSNQLRMDNLVLSCPKSNTKEQKLK